jgi:hypothetical protein
MATIEEQLLSERQKTWKRFSVSGFVISAVVLLFLLIMLLAAVH